uniref:Rhodanese domain-containing protein n=1 Tax=Ditylum brightwellii TaxID=49249 RepID=A0A7S2E7D6_9STRA
MEQSLENSQFYQSFYPDIPPMSSSELLKLQQNQTSNSNNSRKLIVIDVRSEAERAISMIPGSIPLSAFHNDTSKILQLAPDASVVLYCSAGYRSGLECQRLHQLYPHLKGRVYNLDGIVCYTHASILSQQETNTEAAPKLINPNTNKATNVVHTFGPSWSNVNEHFEAVYFHPLVLLCRIIQVGFMVFVRSVQRFVYTGTRLVMCDLREEAVRTDLYASVNVE